MKKHKILVVEDETTLLNAIKEKLENRDFEVVSSRAVDMAFESLKENNPVDAIWLDHYLLGNKDGLDFIAQLKNDDEYKKVPVFVVTNTGSEEKEQSYMELGAEKYYIKSNYKLDQIIEDINSSLK